MQAYRFICARLERPLPACQSISWNPQLQRWPQHTDPPTKARHQTDPVFDDHYSLFSYVRFPNRSAPTDDLSVSAVTTSFSVGFRLGSLVLTGPTVDGSVEEAGDQAKRALPLFDQYTRDLTDDGVSHDRGRSNALSSSSSNPLLDRSNQGECLKSIWRRFRALASFKLPQLRLIDLFGTERHFRGTSKQLSLRRPRLWLSIAPKAASSSASPSAFGSSMATQTYLIS
jgi:hypothetical protein